MMQDFLWLHIKDMPYFRALLRAVESKFYQGIELPGPTLDVGCGDGHFASITFDRKIEVGMDPWREPLREAASRGNYQLNMRADGVRMPFEDAQFGSAISNSVLEHIPPVDDVLKEISRVLKPDAPFIFCVPNHRFDSQLSFAKLLDRLGLRGLAKAYRIFFEKISRHVHLDPPEVWEKRLIQSGFKLEKWWDYFSPGALAVLEWGHYFGLPSLIAKRLTGRWIVAPWRWSLFPAIWLTRRYYNEPIDQPEGVYTFYVARRS